MSRLSKAWRGTQFHRRLAARCMPRLLIIGAQKGGTSALHSYLAQHPRFAPALEKEVDFFGSDRRYALELEWYAACWNPTAPLRKLRFETSPQYMLAKQAPGRIQKHLPNVKLIALLRDPVSRAHSAWRMYRQQLASDPQFYEKYYHDRYTADEIGQLVRRAPAEFDDFWLAIQREVRCLEEGRSMECGIVELGLYGPQLQRYFDLFSEDQLLVLDNHDLRTDRESTLNRVLRFVGLPHWDWSQIDLSDVFVGQQSAPMSSRARGFLREYYRESNRMLADWMETPPRFARDYSYRRVAT